MQGNRMLIELRAAALWVAMAVFLAPVPLWAQSQGRSLVLAQVLEPPHLDPTAGAGAGIREVTYANIFEGLTGINRDGDVIPRLATEWMISANGLIYSFKLRPGVRFHDGNAFDSSVVRFSYDRARSDGSTNAQKGFFTVIDQIETPDPMTVVIHLLRPEGQFLFNMGQGDAVMVHPATADNNRRRPVGTGPFQFRSWTAGDRVVMVRNPDYWNPSLPQLDQVEIRFISDPSAQVTGLLAGQLDAIPSLSATEAVPQLRSDPRFSVQVGTTEGKVLLALNNARRPFDDIRVRRALTHAIDRKQLIDGAMNGFGTPIGSHFPPHRPGYVDLTGTWPYDPAKAKDLLKQAGFPQGFSTTLRLPPVAYARRSGELVQAFLAEVGVKVELIPMEWAQWLEQVFRGHNYDMTIVAHVEPLDLDIYARDQYYFNYSSIEYKNLFENLTRTIDPGQQLLSYRQLQRKLADDAVNVWLFSLPKVVVSRAGLNGLWLNAPVLAADVTMVSWH